MERNAAAEQVIRELWLDYFNRVLLEKGVIGEREYRRMALRIRGLEKER